MRGRANSVRETLKELTMLAFALSLRVIGGCDVTGLHRLLRLPATSRGR